MDAEALFYKNIESYAKVAPQIAYRLISIDCNHLVFCKTHLGQLNLHNVANHHYYHSTHDAIKEAHDWFQKLDLQHTQVLYVYGVGLGYYYAAAEKWLKKNKKHRLVFLENDLAVLRRLFETEIGKQLVHDRQVEITCFQNIDDDEDKLIFQKLTWSFINMPIQVTSLHSYEIHHKEFFNKLRHFLHHESAINNDLIYEYLIYGVVFFRNYYSNLLELPNSYMGNALFGKFPKIPAIICGAGPSLQKQLPALKELGEKALIFAGGSSLNALNFADIVPHFGSGIDPNYEQFVRVSSNSSYEVPYFYRNRMFHQAFMSIHGPRLYLPGAGGYHIGEWVDKKLKIKSMNFDEGHNVINFCIDIAHLLGCDPIILVGLDLAYTNMKLYAPGVLKDNIVDKKDLLDHHDNKVEALVMKDIYGKKVLTEWKWVAESEWIAEFAKKNKKANIINSTEGGIGIEGIPNIPLQEVIEKYLGREYDLRGLVHGEIQNSPLKKNITTKNIVKLLNELMTSLEKCIEYFDVLIQEGKAARKMIMETKQVPMFSGRAALVETEIVEEPAYLYVLEIFNQMYTHSIFHDVQELQIMQRRSSPARCQLKKIAIDRKRYLFLKHTAMINRLLIKKALKEAKKS